MKIKMGDIQIYTYEEFRETREKYVGDAKCFAAGCNRPARYKDGDIRFYCGMCEEHAGIKEDYRRYLERVKRKLEVRMMWNHDVIYRQSYEMVVQMLEKGL